MGKKKAAAVATAAAPRDTVNVVTFGVGHGDCMLVEFSHEGRIEFRLLYDGGTKLPTALAAHLRAAPRDAGCPDIDIVVLSHVDGDHQGGLHTLFADTTISIGAYWSPCLPAFERLAWLFPPRVAAAVAKAGELEAACMARGIPVIYPMEDYVERFGTHAAVTVSVISPARKLLRRLYTAAGDELDELLSRTPLPLEWLVRGAPEPAGDNRIDSPFDGAAVLDRRQFGAARPIAAGADAALRAKAQAVALADGRAFEPEFFGNGVLNDTSLILVIDTALDGVHRRRIVLSGDQENWSYISARHPMGLAPDVLKVPHHGGRVYLGDINGHRADDGRMAGIGQFFIWMRPRVAIVSARGLHGLPRPEFREAVRMVGATLVCPNVRTREVIFDGADPGDASCYAQHACVNVPQHEAIVLTMSAQREEMNAAACLQGTCHRGAAPVVVMQQRLIEPDESFVRWTGSEVRKQAEWLREFLVEERKRLVDSTANALDARVGLKATGWERVRAEAKARGYTQFLTDPAPVLRYARGHDLIWWSGSDTYPPLDPCSALTKTEYEALRAWLTGYDGVLLKLYDPDAKLVARRDWFALLQTAELDGLWQLCAVKAALPPHLFKQEVAPRLLRDLPRQFDCHMVRQPHVDSGACVLHLHRKSRAVDDFLGPAWDALRFEKLSGTDHLTQLLDAVTLPPLSVLTASVPTMDTSFLRDLVLISWERDEDLELTAGEFDTRLAALPWKPLWKRGDNR